ncbi:hypothetical protein BVY04_01935 [bacterium M21]|nr:hypothetical protein BVY04_01935 [bacterium M21]
MRIVIVTGFLGSGKTTVLLSFAKHLAECGQRIAIIENEVGAVGIDDHMLREEGLSVREIFSGCICCSLRLDLVNTLLELERDQNPDVVFIEPSGVAGPSKVLQALLGYGGEIESRHVFTIVDAKRFLTLEKLSLPIIEDGLRAADLIVLNKTDLLDDAETDMVADRIRTVSPDAEILPISCESGRNLDRLETYFDAIYVAPDREAADVQELTEKNVGPKPVVYAPKVELAFEPAIEGLRLHANLVKLVGGVAVDLKAADATLIGNLKAIAKTAHGGYGFSGTTEFDLSPSVRGTLPNAVTAVTITINAIIYGIEKDCLCRIIDAQLDTIFSTAVTS